MPLLMLLSFMLLLLLLLGVVLLLLCRAHRIRSLSRIERHCQQL
jgi:hypothetical protein